MEPMSAPETIIQANMPIRPLKRVEYERLAAEGYFEDEKVELLFGVVIPMSPTDPAHSMSSYLVRRALEGRIGTRAIVFEARPFAASEISEPEPDVLVAHPDAGWAEHPVRAYLIVEVARTSLRKDKGPKAVLYGLADVDEYWIVNHVDALVEVYRDRHAGEWRSKHSYGRGDTIAMAAFPDVTIAVTEILPPA